MGAPQLSSDHASRLSKSRKTAALTSRLTHQSRSCPACGIGFMSGTMRSNTHVCSPVEAILVHGSCAAAGEAMCSIALILATPTMEPAASMRSDRDGNPLQMSWASLQCFSWRALLPTWMQIHEPTAATSGKKRLTSLRCETQTKQHKSRATGSNAGRHGRQRLRRGSVRLV